MDRDLVGGTRIQGGLEDAGVGKGAAPDVLYTDPMNNTSCHTKSHEIICMGVIRSKDRHI